MHRDQAPTQPKKRYAATELTRVRRRIIYYFDAQALTRDCIAHELARRLPDFNIIEHSLVEDLAATEDVRLQAASVAVVHVHADGYGQHPYSESETSGVSNDLSMLERAAPEVPRILLSEVEVPEHILAAFHQRVRGYVPTTLPIDQVAEAIRFVAAGGTFVPESILSLHMRSNPDAQDAPASPDLNAVIARFSPRQGQVLRMLWKGCSNKLIAYELQMCESTVKVHIRHIMRKLNVSNRTQVVLKTRPQLLDVTRPKNIEGSAGRDARLSNHTPASRRLQDQTNGLLLERLEDTGIRSIQDI